MIVPDGDNFRIQGRITIANANAVLSEGLKLFVGDGQVVDLSQLEEVDSSAISLVLEWLREAQRNQRKLSFINLPDNLKSLATLYSVLDLIQPAEAG
ncbi:lipid asymmetry maintenance protein MlaB [Sulfuricella sp. T08]|uniref:STAS domain-containing protein n=1 Tax=Sulfuricella sp. T08 TaxID=1632857 RepID=UPI00075127A6|nr:STAS domain-containing protein [Sulfuricella sp. T08]